MPIRLIIADDHPLILDGMENLFRPEHDLQVVARCINGEETLKALHQHEADILILDIRMPGKSGLEVIREVKKEKLPVKIILHTAALDENELVEAVSLEVQGIILKEMAPQSLVQCIRKVHAGERWVERETTGKAMEKMLRREAGMREMAAQLTAREIEIVHLVAHGLRNKEIGNRLFISEGTVKIHLHNIYEKLNVDGRMALLRYVQEKKII